MNDHRALVIAAAKVAVDQEWTPNAAVDVATRKAQRITASLQRHLLERDRNRFEKELEVPGLKERIDVFDRIDQVTYELKVSPNNTHMEFYRDIFKVIAFNRLSPEQRIRELVFMIPEEGAAKIRQGLGFFAVKIASELGFHVSIEGL
jgi:hypothetical protein